MIEYNVTKAEIQTAGAGYAVNDVLTADLDLEDAKFKVTAVKPLTYVVVDYELTTGGEGYEQGETITIAGSEAGDVPAVLTISAVSEGMVTGLTITNAGAYASNISGEVPTASMIYEGTGTGLEFNVTANASSDTGAITALTITNSGESSTGTVSNPVSVTGGTGSGAKLTLTLSLPFEEVEVSDVPGTMPKPATSVEYVNYSVSYPELPIDYNTEFTRQYPVA